MRSLFSCPGIALLVIAFLGAVPLHADAGGPSAEVAVKEREDAGASAAEAGITATKAGAELVAGAGEAVDVPGTALEVGVSAAIGYGMSAAAVGTLFAATLALSGPAVMLSLPLAPLLLLAPPLVGAGAAGIAAWPRLPWWGAAGVLAGALLGLAVVTVPIAVGAFALTSVPGFPLGVPLGIALYVAGPAVLAGLATAGLGAAFALLAPPTPAVEGEMR